MLRCLLMACHLNQPGMIPRHFFIYFLCFCIALTHPGCSKKIIPSSTSPGKAEYETIELVPWHSFVNENDLDILLNEIGNSRIVLLGESTHGTHEFYQLRSLITKKLVKEKGFDLIGIEGDWVDTYRVNEYIKGPAGDSSSAIQVLKQFDRWPSSTWGNYEMAELVQWLNGWNQQKEKSLKVGIYGLDVYSFWEWTYQSLPYTDPALKKMISGIRERFDSFNNDALKYAAAVKTSRLNNSLATQSFYDYVNRFYKDKTKDSVFLLHQYALLALDGERYFRSMMDGKINSWNIRENHMTTTIMRLLENHGKNSKAVIWVHNGHAGDAAYSQMVEAGYVSIGQLLKKEFENKVFSIGFGTDRGQVYAGYYWNAPLQTMPVPPSRKGSWENILHELSADNKILLSRELKENKLFNQWLPFRSIGAAYSNNAIYGTAILPKRFDALIYLDSTSALHPLR